MGIKKKHPQGVEQFADSHNDQANATPLPKYTTTYGTAFEKICAEIQIQCRNCNQECLLMKCLAYRIDRIISDRDQDIRNLDMEEFFEKGDDNQISLFEP